MEIWGIAFGEFPVSFLKRSNRPLCKTICGVAPHPLSGRRTRMYASLLRIYVPYNSSFFAGL